MLSMRLALVPFLDFCLLRLLLFLFSIFILHCFHYQQSPIPCIYFALVRHSSHTLSICIFTQSAHRGFSLSQLLFFSTFWASGFFSSFHSFTKLLNSYLHSSTAYTLIAVLFHCRNGSKLGKHLFSFQFGIVGFFCLDIILKNRW